MICDARLPLISDGKLREELVLYNLNSEEACDLCGRFLQLTGKSIDADCETANLSGGQKVVLMFLLAMLSPARNIVFIDLMRSLDAATRILINQMIESAKPEKEIILEDAEDVDG